MQSRPEAAEMVSVMHVVEVRGTLPELRTSTTAGLAAMPALLHRAEYTAALHLQAAAAGHIPAVRQPEVAEAVLIPAHVVPVLHVTTPEEATVAVPEAEITAAEATVAPEVAEATAAALAAAAAEATAVEAMEAPEVVAAIAVEVLPVAAVAEAVVLAVEEADKSLILKPDRFN